MNPYYTQMAKEDSKHGKGARGANGTKDGMSISSLLGDDTKETSNGHSGQEQEQEQESKRAAADVLPEEAEEQRKPKAEAEPEPAKEPESRRATRRSTRVAIESIVDQEDKPKPAPKTRKPRATKKKSADVEIIIEQPEQSKPKPKPKAHPQSQEPPQHVFAVQTSPSGMKPNIFNLVNGPTLAADAAPAPPPKLPPLAQHHLPHIALFQNTPNAPSVSKEEMAKPYQPTAPAEQQSQPQSQSQSQSQPEQAQTTSLPSQDSNNSTPSQPRVLNGMVESPMLPSQAGLVTKPVTMSNVDSTTLTSQSDTTQQPQTDSTTKGKGGKKRKAETPASASGAAPAKKGKKKASTGSGTGSAGTTPAITEPPEMSYTETMNSKLKQPNPNCSIPPPVVLDVTPSSKDNGNPEEPIISIHVPLRTPTDGPGSAQVVFNVMKMCEDKYGWSAVHPNATKFSMDMYNDDDLDDDDDDMEDEDEEEPGKEKEPKEPKEPKEQKEQKESKEPVKIDGRKLQKGKPKIGQYDVNDPFIDDSEMLWEEQRASTKDGFFVFWGPLVEEGTSARIERADGTVKRNRKKGASVTPVGTAATKKRVGAASRQQSPKPTTSNASTAKKPLMKIAPYIPVAPKP